MFRFDIKPYGLKINFRKFRLMEHCKFCDNKSELHPHAYFYPNDGYHSCGYILHTIYIILV